MSLSAAGLGPTYRLQLHPGFGFADAERTVPYLSQLGIATLYLSPIAEAVPGSTHGYDGIDPTRLRAELGGSDGFTSLVATCATHGLGICVDHVPNHLAAWPGGGWWRRLLAEGPDSPMGEVFDVDWDAAARGRRAGALSTPGRKVTLAILDRPLEAALAEGRLRLSVRATEPVIEVGPPGLTGIDLPISGGGVRDGEDVAEVLAVQHYRLVDWHDSADRNYRRFFDIDGLAGVRVEVPAVFDATHALLLSLVEAGHVSAIRIDHVDGLREPTAYLRRLADRTGLPIVVEKILTDNERLRADWPVRGTTGYEVIDDIAGALVDAHGYDRLVAAARAEGDAQVDRLTVDCRRLVAMASFPGEFARIATRLEVDADALREVVVHLPRYRTYLGATGADVDSENPAQAEVGEGDEVALEAAVWRQTAALVGIREDRRARDAPDEAGMPSAASGKEVTVDATRVVDAVLDPRHLPGTLALQQLTGALMAKGVEDTAWYRLAGPLACCEVGGAPGRSRHDAVPRWHAHAAQRVGTGHHGLVPGTTHDTKRALDVRCRLYALSEMPTAFDEGLGRFRQALETAASTARAPVSTETLLYETRVLAQLALGILPPLPTVGTRPDDDHPAISATQGAPGTRSQLPVPGDASWPAAGPGPIERLGDALVKGAREGKRRSSWQAPEEAYEARLRALAGATLRDEGALLRACFGPVVDEAARLGAVRSLGAVVLQHALPGIPDCYQGDEVWNLSLVDPDNRRPVDFELLSSSLASLGRDAETDARRRDAVERRRRWRDGTVKLLVTACCMAARRGPAAAAFAPSARYHPLAARGPAAASVLAFARAARATSDDLTWAIAVVTRLPGRLSAPGDDLPAGDSYARTDLPLPDNAPARLVDALTGRTVAAHGGAVALDEVLDALPVALLLGHPTMPARA